MELARLANEEIAHYANQVQLIDRDLNAIKMAIRNLMDSNAVELMQEQYPIQFFNLNASDQNDTLKGHIESERKSLEKMFADEKSRIENIKQIMWDCFETKPQKLQGIYTDIFIQNYPLTDLDEKLNDEAMLKKVLENEELFRQICELKPWIHPNISIKTEIEWPKEPAQCKSTSERFSLFASKIVDQQLTANVNLDYNFFATLSIESENIDISNDRLVNDHNIRMHVRFESGFLCVDQTFLSLFGYFFYLFIAITKHNIVRLKKLFNDMYIKMTKVKENELEVMGQRNERLNRIQQDINLMQRLNGDEVTDFDPIRKFDRFSDENPNALIIISSLTIESQFNDSTEESTVNPVKLIRDKSFYRRALDDMMDGVLQVCWEDELKKEPTKPPCFQLMELHGDERALSTAEQMQIQKYQEKLRKLQTDRRQYIAQLFDEKSSLENAIQLQLMKLNRCVEHIIKTKVKAQFAISSEELKILTCMRDAMRFKIICEQERKYV